MTDTIPKRLISDLKDGRVSLFIGAGVSATLGLPSWSGLISAMANDLSIDKDLFARLGSFTELAEFYFLETGDRHSYAENLQKKWKKTDDELLGSQVHRAISELPVGLMYTTNYDDFLERSIALNGKSVQSIVSASDMVKGTSIDVEVVKFHGDLASPDTMVVSESDYFNRLLTDTPLDIRLRADLLSSNFLFLGYSLSDPNVRSMLFRLSQIRRSELGRSVSDLKSYVFTNRLNPVQESIFTSWGVATIIGQEDNAGNALEKFMQKLVKACKL